MHCTKITLSPTLIIDSDHIEYSGELVWEFDIGRWPEDYKVYLLKDASVEADGLIKLTVARQVLIVTPQILPSKSANEITRLTYFHYLQDFTKSDYLVLFKRDHQHLVGHLLDTLVYVLKQSPKIQSVGPLDIDKYAKAGNASSDRLAEELKKHRK